MSQPQNPQDVPAPRQESPQQEPAIPTPPPGYSGYAGYPVQPAQASAQPSTGSPLGRTALIVALIGMALAVIFSIIQPFLFTTPQGRTVATMLGALRGILSLGLFGTALALGIVALRQNAPKGTAGIATGIAISGLFGVIVGWASSLLYAVIPY
ncbi:hypothetical protein [Microbacterium sp. NPDC057650]|uniref:hypothetical protein n=1 Tax=unclassified Microbacterium TaxID=2609290 RepID=UPI00366EF3D9